MSEFTLVSLYEYNTHGIDSAVAVSDRQAVALPEGSFELEASLQITSKIIHKHCDRVASPASLPRNQLEASIAKFPRNTQFLSLYLQGELRTSIHGRIQRLVAHLSIEDGSIVTQLWSIWAEAMLAKSFYDPGSGGAERVRNALDRAINSEKGRHSAALWVLFIEFEALMNRPQAAKQLCYRSIAAIGGCKGKLSSTAFCVLYQLTRQNCI